MDDLDRSILDHLRGDARTSFDRIGEAIGLSASAVKRRVDRMKASGVIRRFTVDVDPALDERGTEAYVELFCRGTVAPGELRRALAGIPEVVDAGTITGEADAIVRIRSRDVPSLEQALERIRLAPNVERTRSAVLLTRLVERSDTAPSEITTRQLNPAR